MAKEIWTIIKNIQTLWEQLIIDISTRNDLQAYNRNEKIVTLSWMLMIRKKIGKGSTEISEN
jgi:hypothetical protein